MFVIVHYIYVVINLVTIFSFSNFKNSIRGYYKLRLSPLIWAHQKKKKKRRRKLFFAISYSLFCFPKFNSSSSVDVYF